MDISGVRLESSANARRSKSGLFLADRRPRKRTSFSSAEIPRAFRNVPRATHRTQQVLKPENVHYIKILQPRPAVTLDRRIPTHSPVMQPCRHIDGLHAILIPPPTKRRPFSGDFFFRSLQSLFQSPVGGENGDLGASPRQTF